MLPPCELVKKRVFDRSDRICSAGVNPAGIIQKPDVLRLLDLRAAKGSPKGPLVFWGEETPPPFELCPDGAKGDLAGE